MCATDWAVQMDHRPAMGEKRKDEKPKGFFFTTHVGVSRSAQDLVELGWEVILSPSVGRNVIGRVFAEVTVCVVRAARRLLLRAAGMVAQVGFGPTLAWLPTLIIGLFLVADIRLRVVFPSLRGHIGS